MCDELKRRAATSPAGLESKSRLVRFCQTCAGLKQLFLLDMDLQLAVLGLDLPNAGLV